MTDKMAEDIHNKMEERMEDMLNKGEAHSMSRVAGLKSILKKHKGDKELLVALNPLLKRSSAALSATNQSLEAAANLTSSKVATDVSGVFKDLQKHDTPWHMKGLLHSFNVVLNVAPQKLRTTATE